VTTTGESRDPTAGQLIDLARHVGFRPDIATLARDQVASARRHLDLTPDEFAELLTPLVGWPVTPEAIGSWETNTVPPGDVLVAASVATQHAGTPTEPHTTDLIGQLIGNRFDDVTAIYATRSEFTSNFPPHALLDDAKDICAAGVSLNLICQQFADQRLRQLIQGGATMRCLFLDPAGEAIKAREREEAHPVGRLSVLTEINIQTLQRVREQLPEETRARLELATYDETIRFNILLIDRQICVMQPYLVEARGVDSPTFVMRRRRSTSGLYPVFEQTFAVLWAKGTPV
jgi:Domain of unknown function (DUF5919)